MTTVDKKKAALAFAEAWRGRGYEKGDAQVFWTELLQSVVGISHVSSSCRFEYRTASGGYIDCLIPDSGVLVEQKGLGVDLDKPEERQGRMVTPFEQALAYAESFPQSRQPRFIVICNFEAFRVHDRESCSKEELPSRYLEFTLEELGEKPHHLDFIVDPKRIRQDKEQRVSMEAGRLIGELHEMLRGQYLDPDTPENQHALNVLCVRLVFCLFCEDSAGLFPKDAFLNFLRNVEPQDMRMALKRLFRALNTPKDKRDPYDESVKPFPYVGGSLFAEDTEIPNFTQDIKLKLLLDVSQQTDWSSISPTIFGGIFESTLNPETRHSGGMHYTSPENIHKVIDPLFLDALREELDGILSEEAIEPAARKKKLEKYREKLASLRFLDPACGSGNFLTETYLSLRKLQSIVNAELNSGQIGMFFDDDALDAQEDRISLAQFSGIEINDFAAVVAQAAMWIAYLQANADDEMLIDSAAANFPLRDGSNIVEGNALRMDWSDVVLANKCSYVMGNPPFLGARNQSKEQKEELALVFGGAKNCGNVDYVAGWYKKAADYIGDYPVRCAFVSTNSICQGEQVANVWKPLWDENIRIDFAYDTFRWTNEAEGMAHVFCIIVGFSRLGGPKKLFHHESPDVDAVEAVVSNINPYLLDAPDSFIWNRRSPLCTVPEIGIGNKPIDGGNYLFKEEEMALFIQEESASAEFFHPWMGSDEFIKGKHRWVLWLGDVSPVQLKAMPKCRERIQAVREFRLASKSMPTRKLAERPHRFHVENMPEGMSIVIPEVSSERRRYIPMGFVGPETICSSLVRLVPDAGLYHLGVLHSRMHNAWMRVVCGRLKSDYRYSGGVVYNNFPWPGASYGDARPVEELVDVAVKERIEQCAQAVLDARAKYDGSTIADMYDPDNDFLFPELIKAHRELDAAVEAAYGVDFDGDEERMVAYLFNMYATLTEGE